MLTVWRWLILSLSRLSVFVSLLFYRCYYLTCAVQGDGMDVVIAGFAGSKLSSENVGHVVDHSEYLG